MKKQKVTKIISSAIPLEIENVDTDQIIPARFLKATTREGFGQNVFRDLRYDQHNKPNPDFVLNNQKYKGQILIAVYNFGCGSSREHAAWALSDYGFKAIIAPTFADIFFSNAGKNGIVLVRLSEEQVAQLISNAKTIPNYQLTV